MMMEGDKAMSREVLIRLNLQPECLGCIVAQIDMNEKRSSSLFHWQIFKSRYLALSYSDLLSAPVPEHYQEFQAILVVANRDLIENGQIDAYLREARLIKKRSTLKASSAVIQTTLHFTLTTRLAPEWNAISCKSVSHAANGNILLRGKNFLVESRKSPVEAMQIRVFVADSVAWIGLRALRTRLSQISLEDLSINDSDITNLLCQPNGIVVESKISSPWVHVVPSLKRGRVIQVSKGFPVDCGFQNLDDLSKHWRKTYGYILPQLSPSSTPVFASVSFFIGGRPFLYPMECLLKMCPTSLHHPNPEAMITDFVGDVRKCFPDDITVEIAGTPVAELVTAGRSQQFPNLEMHPLAELLKNPRPLVAVVDERETAKNLPAVSKAQPGLHFSSTQSSVSVRRPLQEVSVNVISQASVKNQSASLLTSHNQSTPSQVSQKSSSIGQIKSKNHVGGKAIERKPKSFIDIENLCKVGNLRKATSVQLQAWLQENGLKIQGRPKKQDLIEKVTSELEKKSSWEAAMQTVNKKLQEYRY